MVYRLNGSGRCERYPLVVHYQTGRRNVQDAVVLLDGLDELLLGQDAEETILAVGDRLTSPNLVGVLWQLIEQDRRRHDLARREDLLGHCGRDPDGEGEHVAFLTLGPRAEVVALHREFRN